jgi:hypothetical protein
MVCNLLSEKCYSISPYAYCNNNPINNVDLRGDTITTIIGGSTYTWGSIDGTYGFVDSSGSLYSGTDTYALALTDALNELRDGNVGRDLVDYLAGDAGNMSIRAARVGESNSAFGSEGVVWDSNSTTVAGMNRDPFVALGHEFAGLFSNCDELADQIFKSSITTGEKVWRMPMTEHFDEGIDSDIADMQNIAKQSIRGGSITAAQFLKRFVNGRKWVHIDIAGVETTAYDDFFICSKGVTGFGVHLLYDFLYENHVK